MDLLTALLAAATLAIAPLAHAQAQDANATVERAASETKARPRAEPTASRAASASDAAPPSSADPPPLPASPTHPAWRSGLVWTLGVGEPYAWLGGDLAYYVPFTGARLAVAPHAALGRMPPGYGLPWEWGARAGLTLMFGRANRFLIDASYGALGAGPVVLHGAVVAGRVVEGVSLLGGYEWMWPSGLLTRVWAGPALITESLYPEDDRIDFVMGLGLGWKPW